MFFLLFLINLMPPTHQNDFHVKGFLERQRDNTIKVMQNTKDRLIVANHQLSMEVNHNLKTGISSMKKAVENSKDGLVDNVKVAIGWTGQNVKDGAKYIGQSGHTMWQNTESDRQKLAKQMKEQTDVIRNKMGQGLEHAKDTGMEMIKDGKKSIMKGTRQQLGFIKSRMDDKMVQIKSKGQKEFDKVYVELEDQIDKVCDKEDQKMLRQLVDLIQKKRDEDDKMLQQKYEHIITQIDQSIEHNIEDVKQKLKQQLQQLDDNYKQKDNKLDDLIDKQFKTIIDHVNSQDNHTNTSNNYKVQFNRMDEKDWKECSADELEKQHIKYLKQKTLEFMQYPQHLQFYKIKKLSCDDKYFQDNKEMKCLVNMVYKNIMVHNVLYEFQIMFENRNRVPQIQFISRIN